MTDGISPRGRRLPSLRVRATATVQTALDNLRQVGQLIVEGDTDKLQAQVSPSSPWVVNLKDAANKMATSPETKKLATAFFTDYEGLASSVQTGSASLKSDYVKTTKSFQSWCLKSGIANELVGF